MALAHRLNELNLLTEWGYRSIAVQLSRQGYRRTEPNGLPRESSQALTKVFQATRSDGLSPAKIAKDIGINVDDLRDYVFGLTPTYVAGQSQSEAKKVHRRLQVVQ